MSNSLYISLAFLMTSALDRIQLNQNVKYRKIPFGHGVGKIMIDETLFPLEESLAETDFWQASKNWLILVETLASPAITEGWRAHHRKMLSDCHFSQWYPAWQAHDKLLRVRFMTRPFIIDLKGLVYAQQFERCRTDLALLGDPHASSTASTSTASLNDRHPISWQGDVNFRSTGSSSMSSSRYVPYDKENHQNSSFRPSETTTLCLRCGKIGHRALACSSSVSSCPEHAIIVEWRAGKLINKAGRHICLQFNAQGHCDATPTSYHGDHCCSLCADAHQGGCACTRN